MDERPTPSQARRDTARTGRAWLTGTALACLAAAAILGTTTAWVVMGTLAAVAALGAIGAHRDAQ